MAMKKLIRNNRGFTLVELLVTFGFSRSSWSWWRHHRHELRTYKNISDDLNLQYESQLA
jgi:hypothetical protein